MRHGFSHGVAPGLIWAEPGKTPEYYARTALERGLATSDSKDPVFSLASTLRKEVREGRLPEFVQMKVGGRFCVFPANGADQRLTPDESKASQAEPSGHGRDLITIRVSESVSRVADLLVEVGMRVSRSDAVAWMADEWVAANAQLIARAEDASERIRQIRNSLRTT